MIRACECGHPWSEHGHVAGVDLGDGTRLPDVWVCGAGRLADLNAPDFSPWDCVCGCVIREDDPWIKRVGLEAPSRGQA